MEQPTSEDSPSFDAAAYLRAVVRRLNAIKILHDAALRGTLADPYAVSDEIHRAVQELEAVMGSLEN